MKITRGTYKRRNIVSCPEIRPVLERVREACFNMIKDIVPEASVLDLFAGSGALGLEALSCGASTCCLSTMRKLSGCRKGQYRSFRAVSTGETAYGDAFRKVKEFALRKYALIWYFGSAL